MHIGSDNATTDAGMTEDHFSESMSKGTTPGPVTGGGNENNDNSNNSYGKNKITNTNSLMTNIGTTDFSGTTGINLSSITNRPVTIASITKVVLINNETNIVTTEYSETKYIGIKNHEKIVEEQTMILAKKLRKNWQKLKV